MARLFKGNNKSLGNIGWLGCFGTIGPNVVYNGWVVSETTGVNILLKKGGLGCLVLTTGPYMLLNSLLCGLQMAIIIFIS